MRKLFSLIAILAMLFAVSPALAEWQPNVHVDGQSYRHASFNTGGDYNFAGGGNNSYGDYDGIGQKGIWGSSGADGTVIAGKARGNDWRAAGALSWSSSEAEMGGVRGPIEGYGISGGGEVNVVGFGDAYHRTNLSGDTGGWTTGYAAYAYRDSDHGFVGSLCPWLAPYGPDTNGYGIAGTGGVVWRTSTPNSVSSHARSGSFAISSGGGSLPNGPQ